MAVLLSDTFTRANSTSALGTPSVGGPYTVRSGTWGINNNQAYTSSSTTNAHVTFPAAFNLDISVEIPVLAAGGFIFRWVDASNYWCMRNSGSQWALYHRAAAVNSLVVAAGPSWVAGDRVGVVAYGKVISLYVNGIVQVEVEDGWVSTGATVAGLVTDSSTTRFDNLTVETADDPGDKPNGWGTSPTNLHYELADSTVNLIPSLYKGRDTAAADESEIP